MYQFGFIGTGTMAGAMLQAALEKNFLRPEEILVYDKNAEAAQRFGVKVAKSAREVAAQCKIIQLGVKPQDQSKLLESLKSELDERTLVISIAAGIKLEKIPAKCAVRLMPNMNATVGQGMTAYCATELVAAEQLGYVRRYCECFGQALALEEQYFSAFLALAASAPAFVYLFIDELACAGVSAGLPKAMALQIATQTVLGSAVQMQKSDAHPRELIDRVCSPGGTTIAGMNALREHGFDKAVLKAVTAAYHRDQELGK